MKPGILHLGPKGIITEPEDMMRQLFIDAFTANKPQGKGMAKVFSLQYITGLYGNNREELVRQLESGLRSYYGAYFPEGATVTVRDLDSNEKARYTVEFSVRVTHSGQVYELQEVLQVDPDNTMSRIQDAI